MQFAASADSGAATSLYASVQYFSRNWISTKSGEKLKKHFLFPSFLLLPLNVKAISAVLKPINLVNSL